MKKILVLLLVIVEAVIASNIPTEVENAISQALSGKWAFQNFDKNKLSFGFDSATQLSDIKPGDPFQIFTISQSTFEKAEDSTPVGSLVQSGGWYVPLYVQGKLMQTVMLITKFGEQEKWSAGAFGLKNLVETWDQVKKGWPENDGYHPELVVIAESYENNLCFHIPEKGPYNLTILGQFYIGFEPLPNINYSNLTPSSTTMRSIKDRTAETLKRSDSLWAEKNRVNDSLGRIREKATESLWKKIEMHHNAEPLISSSAVTASWDQMLTAADAAIIPYDMSKKEFLARSSQKNGSGIDDLTYEDGLNDIEIDETVKKSSQPLCAGAPPIDNTIEQNQEQWFILNAKDGPGYIRIGATGPLFLKDAPYVNGKKWGLGGAISSYNGPQNDADLIEISATSITQMALIWKVDSAFLKIKTNSIVPVLYRISFVSELPLTRTGCRYGPGVAADTYITAVSMGNTADLYNVTRIRFSEKETTKLRIKLFGSSDVIGSRAGHRRPDAIKGEAEGNLHVQHIILSTGYQKDLKYWAFEIICVKRDGLWLVADCYRDPALSDRQVEEIVRCDLKENYK